ncbi:MAG: hypothetical protein CFH38_00589, partial [Alphaproteobacteria bacterium MarineAlpha10_Bin1]
MKTDTKKNKTAGEKAAEKAVASGAPGELIYSGLGVSAGIAIGPAHVMERGLIDVPD